MIYHSEKHKTVLFVPSFVPSPMTMTVNCAKFAFKAATYIIVLSVSSSVPVHYFVMILVSIL